MAIDNGAEHITHWERAAVEIIEVRRPDMVGIKGAMDAEFSAEHPVGAAY